MYHNILLPTDGSQEMETVVMQGLELAALCEATVHVLHVIDERAYPSVPDDARDRVNEVLESDAEAATKAVAERAVDAGIDVVREIRWGDPSSTIIGYAVDTDVDLIVMGTHGRTGYERYLLGSVAERVVQIAPLPVLTIAVGDLDERREAIREGTNLTMQR